MISKVRSQGPVKGTRRPQAGGATTQSMPFAVGFNLGPSLAPSQGYLPQLDTDQTSAKDWSTQTGVRVYGSDVANFFLASSQSTNTSYYLITTNATSSSSYTATVGLTPSTISSKLSLQESIYQWYAWRELKIEFLPTGVPNSAQSAFFLAAGILSDLDNADSLTNSSTLFQQALQIVPSVGWTAWENATLIYSFHGKKLWETDVENSSFPEVYTQCMLVAGTRNTQTGGNLTLAMVRITYIIDFYCPTFITHSPALSARLTFAPFQKAVFDLLRDMKKDLESSGDTKRKISDAVMEHVTDQLVKKQRSKTKLLTASLSPRDTDFLKFMKSALDYFCKEPSVPMDVDPIPLASSSMSAGSSSSSGSTSSWWK